MDLFPSNGQNTVTIQIILKGFSYISINFCKAALPQKITRNTTPSLGD